MTDLRVSDAEEVMQALRDMGLSGPDIAKLTDTHVSEVYKYTASRKERGITNLSPEQVAEIEAILVPEMQNLRDSGFAADRIIAEVDA